MRLSKRDIESLANNILYEYSKKSNWSFESGEAINIDELAKLVLNLDYKYMTLSSDGSILGMTTSRPVWALMKDEHGEMVWEHASKDIAYIDSSLKEKDQEGRRNFTKAHEAAHQILFNAFPESAEYSISSEFCKTVANNKVMDFAEWQADMLASMLLIPERTLKLQLRRYGIEKIHILDSILNKRDYEKFSRVANNLKVSKQALAFRMEGLGLIDRNYISNPGSLFEIWR